MIHDELLTVEEDLTKPRHWRSLKARWHALLNPIHCARPTVVPWQTSQRFRVGSLRRWRGWQLALALLVVFGVGGGAMTFDGLGSSLAVAPIPLGWIFLCWSYTMLLTSLNTCFVNITHYFDSILWTHFSHYEPLLAWSWCHPVLSLSTMTLAFCHPLFPLSMSTRFLSLSTINDYLAFWYPVFSLSTITWALGWCSSICLHCIHQPCTCSSLSIT